LAVKSGIFIRLVVGFHLVFGTQDNVFSYARMEEFAGFLQLRGVPYPLFSVFLSAYAIYMRHPSQSLFF
jgi:putative oxidoreductase